MPALSKFAVFDSVNYKPHRSQKIVHRHGARHKVVTAGRRFGKSNIGGHELAPEALLTYTLAEDLKRAGKRREFWIVGPEYSDSEKEFRVLYNALERLDVPFDHPGTYNAPWSGDMRISLWDGLFQVHAKSAKYPATLVGEGLSGVIMAEAAKLKPSIWHKFIRPTLADFRGWSLHTTTPEGKNWLYEMWQRGQDPADTEWQSWRMPSWANPVVFPNGRNDPEIKDMEADMSVERFRQEIGAEFSEYVGRVFKDWDEETHVQSLNYNPDLPVHLAFDYGWTNPFVCLAIQVDVWENVYILGEYRANQMTAEEHAKELKEWRGGLARAATWMYPDPAEPADTEVLCRDLKLKAVGGVGGEMKIRLDLIRKWLKLVPEHAEWEDREPKLFVDRSCKHLINEMDAYRYPETKEEASTSPAENPMKKDDHGPEALGRFMLGYFGSSPTGENNRAVVRKALVSS